MAEHSSAPSRPCATQRYCHSSAFILGHVSAVHICRRRTTRGVKSIGIRLIVSPFRRYCSRHTSDVRRSTISSAPSHKDDDGLTKFFSSPSLPLVLPLPFRLLVPLNSAPSGRFANPSISCGSCLTFKARYSARWKLESISDNEGGASDGMSWDVSAVQGVE